ncbi:MAG: glycoside hydrolase family 2 protein [Trueperaceae bacterium]
MAHPQPIGGTWRNGEPVEIGGLDPTLHPRPRLRRDGWRSLDGWWDFRRGDEEGSPRPGTYPDRIRVPFAPESPASGIGDPAFHRVLWYRRRIDPPTGDAGRRMVLHLSGIDGRVDAWCDGERVARLEQAQTPVEVDLGALDGGAAPVVELRIERDPLDLGASRGKQDWQPAPHAIWYPRSSGVTRSVWVEAVPPQRVLGIDATADLAAFALDLRVRLDGIPHGTPVADGWRLAVRLAVGGRLLADERWAVAGPEVRRRVHLSDPGIDDARGELLWSPERPTLIDVTATLERDGEAVDAVASYAALRTVGVDGDAFLLNGRPYPLRLVLDQGYWPETHRTAPEPDALRRDVELAKALGFNGVRKHQTLEDPRYLAWADRLGLLVWAELPSAYAFGPATVARLTSVWTGLIERDAGHPCVVAWVAFNESWGVPDLSGRPDQRHAVRALYHLAKALDPSRPVIGNDGWENVVGDLRTVHDYAADPAVLAARYGTREALAETLRRFRPGGRRIVLDDDAVTGPVLLTEFGGVRVEGDDPGWGYAQVDGADALLTRYRDLLAAVHRSALAGFCYTQLTDTFQEQNGLLTMDRRPKADLAAIARATRGEEGPSD